MFSGQNQTFFNYIHQRQNIPDARYQYSQLSPDISGSWRLRG